MDLSPRPPYDATAARPDWTELPAAVRARVEELSGASVARVEKAGGGFTRGFAGLLHLADGTSVFVKSASGEEQPIAASSYRTEAAVLAALPPSVPAPSLRWSDETAGWVVLGIAPVTGRMPGLPWTAQDLQASVRACETAADALAQPPDGLPLTRLADDLSGDAPYLSWFGDQAMLGGTSDLLTPWAVGELRELQRLVEDAGAAIDGDTACHGDLRPDNLIVDATGEAWVCDWNWLALGAPWTDLVGLLITAHPDGHDADAVFRSSWLSDGVDDDAVDSWLALIAAFMLSQASHAPSFASSWLPVHRAYFGTAALSWLEQRRTR